jgi:hypothetical protein
MEKSETEAHNTVGSGADASQPTQPNSLYPSIQPRTHELHEPEQKGLIGALTAPSDGGKRDGCRWGAAPVAAMLGPPVASVRLGLERGCRWGAAPVRLGRRPCRPTRRRLPPSLAPMWNRSPAPASRCVGTPELERGCPPRRCRLCRRSSPELTGA